MKKKILYSIILLLFSIQYNNAQPTVELQKFNSDYYPWDSFFGDELSISGNFAIVGAPEEVLGGNKFGTAYIYYFNGTSWVEHTKLIASAPVSYDYFGSSVYISGDYAVVGAWGNSDYYYQSGKVYVFHYDGNTWNEFAQLYASDPSDTHRFGSSVSIKDSLIIVGTIYDNDNGNYAGAAYIFKFDGNSWIQQAKLVASNGLEDDRFGAEVAINDTIAIVGASNHDVAGVNSGAVYIYNYDGNIWTETSILSPSEPYSNQGFGLGLSLFDNYIIIGAPNDDKNGLASGAAFIFNFNGISWNEEARITASDAYAYDNFGGSVSISDSYVIVGAGGNDNNASNSGAAYIFKRTETEWVEQSKFIASDGHTNDRFGSSVGISGDYAFIGASAATYDNGFYGAYVFGPPIPLFITQPINQTEVCEGDNIFFSVEGKYFETYKWQVDEGEGFVDILNEGVYAGVSSNTLYVSLIIPEMNFYKYRCLVSNSFGEGISAAASIIFDTEDLILKCKDSSTIELEQNETSYSILGLEFDPTIIDNNCGTAALVNDYNNTNTLESTVFPIGSTVVSWTFNDLEGNSTTCTHSVIIEEYSRHLWRQNGEDIDGEQSEDLSGSSISLSSNGLILAIGASSNDDNGTNSGHVRIYESKNDVWMQIGEDIDGENKFDWSGASISLNSNGSIVAIGAPYNNNENGLGAGHVRVYGNIENEWIQIGEDINGEDASDRCAYVSINSAGNILVVGSSNYDPLGIGRGNARVFEYIEGVWKQIGDNIMGILPYSHSGQSVSISSDGSVIAIGAPNDGYVIWYYSNVRIFKNLSGNWVQIGDDIQAESIHNYSGRSISLNSDGSIVAIGADTNSDNESYSGHVRVYQNISGNWIQLGNDIDGRNDYEYFGRSVSLNSKGNILAIGAVGSYSGHVSIYQFLSGEWIQIWNYIKGEAEGDKSGSSVCLDSTGSTVAIGASGNDGYGLNSGHVRIYKCPFPTIINQPQAQYDIITGSSVVFTIESEGDEISYQWRKDNINLTDGGNINGVLTNTLSLSSVSFDDEGLYDCLVTDCGTLASELAELSIYKCPFPTIINQPQAQYDIITGSSVVFTIESEGDEISYQWRKDNINLTDGGNINGVLTNTLSLSSVSFDDEGLYDCLVTDCGTLASELAELSIYIDPLVDIEKLNFKEIFFFPNPSNGIITFNTDAYLIKKIFIIDITGKTIFIKTNLQHDRSIDISSFESGFYIINILTDKKLFTSKLVKE